MADIKEGDLVEVTRDDGTVNRTIALSDVFESASGHKVIMLQGIRGFFLADRVKSVSKEWRFDKEVGA